MEKSIKIITRLHDAVCAPNGDKTITHKTYSLKPGSLIVALRELPKISDRMTRAYGTIGHVWTEIFVCGEPMDDFDILDYEHSTNKSIFRSYEVDMLFITKRDWCEQYISKVVENNA